MKALFLFTILALSVAFAETPANFDAVISHLILPSLNDFELPSETSLVEAAILETKLIASGKAPILSKESQEEINNFGYALEIQNFGDSGTAVIARRAYTVAAKDLNRVTELYTRDLRDPRDKNVIFHGITIERHHWEFKDGRAYKVSEPPGSIQTTNDYKIKKCRNGLMVSWKCNTIAYNLFNLDESSSILVGRQAKTDHEPDYYEFQNCKEGKCSQKFLDEQKHNTAAGTLSFVIFKALQDKEGQSIVKVFETNYGFTTNPTEARHINVVQNEMQEGLGSEYAILLKKFEKNFPESQNKRKVASVADKKTEVLLSTTSLVDIGLGCLSLLAVAVLLIRKFYRFYRSN